VSVATDGSGESLDRLLDVGQEWKEIHHKLQKFDDELRDTVTNRDRHMVEQRRNELFNDKANQIVINYVYSEMVLYIVPSRDYRVFAMC
jgi:hypothetical protein